MNVYLIHETINSKTVVGLIYFIIYSCSICYWALLVRFFHSAKYELSEVFPHCKIWIKFYLNSLDLGVGQETEIFWPDTIMNLHSFAVFLVTYYLLSRLGSFFTGLPASFVTMVTWYCNCNIRVQSFENWSLCCVITLVEFLPQQQQEIKFLYSIGIGIWCIGYIVPCNFFI